MKPSKNIHEKPQVAPTSQAAVQPTMMQFKLDQLLSHETEAVPQKVIHEIDQLIQEASQVGDKRLPHISSRNLGRLLLRKTLLQLNIGKNLEAKRTLQEVLELKETKRVDTGESSKHQVQEISVPIFNEIMATLTSEEQGAIRDLRKGSSTVLALYGASSSSSLPLASITTHPSSSSQPPVDHKDQIIELKLQLEASMKLCERYQEKYLASRSGTREYQTVNKDCEVLKAQCDSDHQEKCQQLEAQFEARHAFEIQSLKKELESKHEEELGKLKEAHQREIESLKSHSGNGFRNAKQYIKS